MLDLLLLSFFYSLTIPQLVVRNKFKDYAAVKSRVIYIQITESRHHLSTSEMALCKSGHFAALMDVSAHKSQQKLVLFSYSYKVEAIRSNALIIQFTRRTFIMLANPCQRTCALKTGSNGVFNQ